MLKVCALSLLLVVQCLGAPLNPNRAQVKEKRGGGYPEVDVEEYMRYLAEIASEDPALMERLKKVKDVDIDKLRAMIATNPHLQERFMQGKAGVRNQADEAKRMTVEKMRQLQKLQSMRNNDLMKDGDWMTKKEAMRENLPSDFSNEDIRRKLQEAQEQMEALDRQRKEDFKQQEMWMEHQRRQKLAHMNEQQRLKAEEDYRKRQEELRRHEKLPKPAGKEQLEEVWEEDDGMAREEFNPRTFFHMHDTNADLTLDPIELEALFYNELKKVYKDDMAGLEAHEDMARMREHAMGEIDKNRDGLISLEEFLRYTGEKMFENEEEWHPVVDEENFSDKEFEEYEEDYDEDYDYQYDDAGNIVGIVPRKKPPPQEQQQQQQQQQQRGDGVPVPGGGVQVDDPNSFNIHQQDTAQHEQRMAPPLDQQQQQQQEAVPEVKAAPVPVDGHNLPEMAAAENKPEGQQQNPGPGQQQNPGPGQQQNPGPAGQPGPGQQQNPGPAGQPGPGQQQNPGQQQAQV